MSILETQVRMISAWYRAGDHIRRKAATDADRGEVTATTAIIVILVIAAGAIIAARITSNAENVPAP